MVVDVSETTTHRWDLFQRLFHPTSGRTPQIPQDECPTTTAALQIVRKNTTADTKTASSETFLHLRNFLVWRLSGLRVQLDQDIQRGGGNFNDWRSWIDMAIKLTVSPVRRQVSWNLRVPTVDHPPDQTGVAALTFRPTGEFCLVLFWDKTGIRDELPVFLGLGTVITYYLYWYLKLFFQDDRVGRTHLLWDSSNESEDHIRRYTTFLIPNTTVSKNILRRPHHIRSLVLNAVGFLCAFNPTYMNQVGIISRDTLKVMETNYTLWSRNGATTRTSLFNLLSLGPDPVLQPNMLKECHLHYGGLRYSNPVQYNVGNLTNPRWTHSPSRNVIICKVDHVPQPCLQCGRFLVLRDINSKLLILEGSCIQSNCPTHIFVLTNTPEEYYSIVNSQLGVEREDEEKHHRPQEGGRDEEKHDRPQEGDRDEEKYHREERDREEEKHYDDNENERTMKNHVHVGIDASPACISLYIYKPPNMSGDETLNLLRLNTWTKYTRSVTFSTSKYHAPNQPRHIFHTIPDDASIIDSVQTHLVWLMVMLDIESLKKSRDPMKISVCVEKPLDPHKERDSKQRFFVRRLVARIECNTFVDIMYGEVLKARQFLVHNVPAESNMYLSYLAHRRSSTELKHQIYRAYRLYFHNTQTALIIRDDETRKHPLPDVVDAFTMLVYTIAHDIYRP